MSCPWAHARAGLRSVRADSAWPVGFAAGVVRAAVVEGAPSFLARPVHPAVLGAKADRVPSLGLSPWGLGCEGAEVGIAEVPERRAPPPKEGSRSDDIVSEQTT